MNANNPQDVKRAAEAFLGELQKTLGTERFAAVVGVNLMDADDLCDTNMVMDAALRSVGVDMEWDPEEGMPDEVVDLWNSAWSRAIEISKEGATVS